MTVIEAEHSFVATNDQRKLIAVRSVQENDVQQSCSLSLGCRVRQRLFELSYRLEHSLRPWFFDDGTNLNHDV
jgi:hypothetical protein